MRRFIFLLSILILSSIANIKTQINPEKYKLSKEEKDRITCCSELVKLKMNQKAVK
jgi:hypothetical protein